MFDTLCEINLSDIDLNDERYRISPGIGNISFLADSIKKIGLISPPVIRPVDNKFIVISGFNRITALLHNNVLKTPVYLAGKETDDFQCLLFAIAALSFKRPLTHVELIAGVTRLSDYLEREEMAKIAPPVFNMQLTPGFIEDLLHIGSLPDPAMELIHTGNLSLKAAKKISFLDKDEIPFFLNIFSKIKASTSIQFEILQNILEISAREGIHPQSFFKEMKIINPLDDETLDAVLRTQRFRTMVFEQRYPVLSQTRRMILDKIAATKLPGIIRLIPLENFESRGYSISFMVKNHDEFQKNVRQLTDVLENKTLREILDS
ncbi:MAG: hypothetical protein A2097_08040 [Desulfobacula sp. GWF2_41_7]|nr:MAG: hypothetical protein A2097_08040 [Desulfobacula sp. GWF2_41_7]